MKKVTDLVVEHFVCGDVFKLIDWMKSTFDENRFYIFVAGIDYQDVYRKFWVQPSEFRDFLKGPHTKQFVWYYQESDYDDMDIDTLDESILVVTVGAFSDEDFDLIRVVYPTAPIKESLFEDVDISTTKIF